GSADRLGFHVETCEMSHQLLGLIFPCLAGVLRQMNTNAVTVFDRRSAQFASHAVRRPLAALHILDVIDPIRINADLRAAGKRATALCGSQVPRATASQVRWSGVDDLDLIHLEEFALFGRGPLLKERIKKVLPDALGDFQQLFKWATLWAK